MTLAALPLTSYTISTSTDGTNFTQVAGGTWAGDRATEVAEWPARNVGFVRIRANAATGGYADMGGVRIGGRTAKPVLVSKVLPGDGTVYRFVNRKSGKVADVYNFGTANGTNIQQWPWLNNTAQKHWAVTPTGDGCYYLTNRFSGLSLNVDGGSTADGANINQFTYNRAPEKQWQIITV